MCIVALMCSFKTSSIPAALLFFNALATFKISLSVISLFISSLSGANTSSVGTVTVFALTSGWLSSLKKRFDHRGWLMLHACFYHHSRFAKILLDLIFLIYVVFQFSRFYTF